MARPVPKSDKSAAALAPPHTLAALRPLMAPRGLTHELVARLTAEITGGNLAPGARLPTEQEMIATTGVSRTVVREAVAALRAEGLVITRQGVGAFVADHPRRPFRIEGAELHSLREVIEVMELRTGLEVEAAGIAAERASPASLRRIGDAYAALQQAIAGGASGVDQDFAFHRSIALATDNPQFARFLEYLGRFIIPRQTVRVAAEAPAERHAYLTRIQKEHFEILGAMRSHAAQAARTAMRRHLLNSRKRYQKLAEMSQG
jgi:GntR family transcriptional regulator, transcriptional repressor for pyruvate dehydrogenase complex